MMKLPDRFHKHYKVPENYFENLEQIRFGQARPKRKWVWPVAASILVIAGLSFSFLKKFESKPDWHHQTEIYKPEKVEVRLDDLPDEVIDDYLLMESEND